MRPEIIGQTMKEFLGVTHHRQHRKAGFDNHALVPGAFLAQFQVGRNAIGIAKAQVGQNDAVVGKIRGQGVEVLIRLVEGQPIPLDHLAGIIQQPPQAKANRPAAFVLAFLADLLLASPLTDWKNSSMG